MWGDVCASVCMGVVGGVDSRGQPGAALGFNQQRPALCRTFQGAAVSSDCFRVLAQARRLALVPLQDCREAGSAPSLSAV